MVYQAPRPPRWADPGTLGGQARTLRPGSPRVAGTPWDVGACPGEPASGHGRTALKPAPFAYHRADSVDQAVALLAGLGDEAKILAGGQSPVPMMNLRRARPSALVDVTRIPVLSCLRPAADGLHIVALTPRRASETTRDPAVTA